MPISTSERVGSSPAPALSGLLESALYVADLARSTRFYVEHLGLKPMLTTPRLAALDAGARGVLLLFAQGRSSDDMPTGGGVIPGHDGSGRLHMAFAIAAVDYDSWRAHLAARGIELRSEVTWPAGGRSLYFEDPDGHVIELATPGLWPNY
jgi:catechol 2,3-dioxygenase-like lactoylglutathione lyase family enzyme